MLKNNINRIITEKIFVKNKIVEFERNTHWDIEIISLEKNYKKSWKSWFQYRKKNTQIAEMIIKSTPGTVSRKKKVWIKYELAIQILQNWDSSLQYILMNMYYKEKFTKKKIKKINLENSMACVYCHTINSSITIGSEENFENKIKRPVLQFKPTYH